METDGYTLEFRVEQDVMHARVAGTYPTAHVHREGNRFQPLVEVCEQSGCQKAVIDARDLQVNFDTMALFRAGVDAASVTRQGLRIAIVAREEIIDSFFQDVVVNRGARVEVFTAMQDAVAWVSGS